MLTRLLPDQISRFWSVIKYAIQESLPPIAGESPDKMNKILASLLAGRAECWASYVREEEVRRFEGIMITKILRDDISDTKNLLIYCLYGYDSVDNSNWFSGLKALVKYASSKNCHRIIAYTDIPYMIELANKLGGESRYTFITFPLV